MEGENVTAKWEKYETLSAGENRCRVYLTWCYTGPDLTVRLFNEGAHVGAVALGQFDRVSGRASVSTITVPGHRDDIVAAEAAKLLAEATRRPVCVAAGIHLEDIKGEEILLIVKNCQLLVGLLLRQLVKQ